MADMVIVKSKIKEVAKGCNVGSDFAEALNGATIEMIKSSAKRAEANGRKTVQGRDALAGEKLTAKVMLVSKSKSREVIGNKFNMSGDFAETLNEMVVWCVGQAAARAEANGRKTIGARDL